MAGKAIGLILTYNCAGMLEDIYRRIPKQALDDIIVSDDGSTDGTLEVAQRLGIKTFPHVHRGYGGNVKHGLRQALNLGADYIVEIHGDGQYDPTPIPAALAKMREGHDFLLGSRFTDVRQPLRDRMSLARYLANRGLSSVDRWVLGLPLTEFHTGFRVYSRKLLESVPFEAGSEDWLFSFEIIVQARFFNQRVGEIPIRCNYADVHTSVSLWRATIYSFETLKTLAQYLLARIGIRNPLFMQIKT